MIRTILLPAHLPKTEADALNHESGRVYSRVLVTHYRIYRKKGIWLSAAAAEFLPVRPPCGFWRSPQRVLSMLAASHGALPLLLAALGLVIARPVVLRLTPMGDA